MPKESGLKQRVADMLRSCDDVWLVKISGEGGGRNGVADLLLCVRGHFVALELKTNTKPTRLQRHELAKVRRAGGVALVARSVPEVAAIIAEIRTWPRSPSLSTSSSNLPESIRSQLPDDYWTRSTGS